MNGKTLPACPRSPNCVSSQAEDGRHFIEPLRDFGSGEAVLRTLKEIIANLPDTRIIEFTDNRLQAEFRTRWLKFIDDFEAVLDPERGVVQVRSASRVGYWDFGTNRRRVEMIRKRLERRLK